jgi:hypothetical protein
VASPAYQPAQATWNLTLQYTWLSLPRPEAGGPPAIRYERKPFGAVTLGYSRQF